MYLDFLSSRAYPGAIELSHHEMLVATALQLRPRSRGELGALIWPGRDFDPQGVTQLVTRVRRKLGRTRVLWLAGKYWWDDQVMSKSGQN